MDNLTNFPIPSTLGAGYRVPGFDPYLEFLRDIVFLKFDTRAYHNAEEKWFVCSGVLEVLHKLLKHHNPEPSHFSDVTIDIEGMGVVPVSRPPGHAIMEHLLNESPFLAKASRMRNKGLDNAHHDISCSHGWPVSSVYIMRA